MQRPSVWRQQRAVKAARTGGADREVCRLLRARSWLQQLLPHPLVLPGHLPIQSWQKVKIWVHRNQRISKRDMAEGRGLNHRARFPCSSFHELGVYDMWRLKYRCWKTLPITLGISAVSREENPSWRPAEGMGQVKTIDFHLGQGWTFSWPPTTPKIKLRWIKTYMQKAKP